MTMEVDSRFLLCLRERVLGLRPRRPIYLLTRPPTSTTHSECARTRQRTMQALRAAAGFRALGRVAQVCVSFDSPHLLLCLCDGFHKYICLLCASLRVMPPPPLKDRHAVRIACFCCVLPTRSSASLARSLLLSLGSLAQSTFLFFPSRQRRFGGRCLSSTLERCRSSSKTTTRTWLSAQP